MTHAVIVALSIAGIVIGTLLVERHKIAIAWRILFFRDDDDSDVAWDWLPGDER